MIILNLDKSKRRADVPVRVASSVVQIDIEPTVATIVAVTAANRQKACSKSLYLNTTRSMARGKSPSPLPLRQAIYKTATRRCPSTRGQQRGSERHRTHSCDHRCRHRRESRISDRSDSGRSNRSSISSEILLLPN